MYTYHLIEVYIILQSLNFGIPIFANEVNYISNVNFQEEAYIEEAILTRQRQRNEIFRQMKQNYIFDELAESIVNIPVFALIEKLQLRSLGAAQVLQAYIAKALIIHDSFNCISEFVPNALEMAQELDRQKFVIGPLHGLPICVKDDHDIIGMDSTLGLGKNLNKPASSNSVLVQSFIDLGAVIFCKTNIPQTLFRYSSHNPIYGETLNHRNVKLSPGGSSCGTASLVGGGGAVFGSGTDIAGSVRIPAHFSGLCTIKPTQNRISSKGILPSLPKLVGLTGIPGILANYDDEGDFLLRLAKESTKESVGSPIGVQIIGKPFKEEIVLRAVRELYQEAKKM